MVGDLLTLLTFTGCLTLNPSAVKCSWLYKGDEQQVNKGPLPASEDAAAGGRKKRRGG